MQKPVLTDWFQIENHDAPMPEIGEEEALVRLICGGICGTDVHVYSHNHGSATVPLVLGHEYCGVIEQVNTKKFPHLAPGDLVTSHPLYACGYCHQCLSGNENACRQVRIYGIHTDGCFAEYFVVPTNKLYQLNREIDPKVSALVEPLAVAVHDVRRSGLKRGDDVFVVSAGPIGVLIALVAQMSGARRVVVSEVNDYRVRLARSLGLTVLSPGEDGFADAVMAQTGGKGYDVYFEASGSVAGTQLATRVIAQQGTIVIVGVPREPYPFDTGAVLAKELRVVGVRIHPQSDFAEAVRIVNSGVLSEQLEKMVTHTFALADLEKAIRFSIEDQAHFKVLLEPRRSGVDRMRREGEVAL